MNIKTISTTKIRQNISSFIENVRISGQPVVIGRRNMPEAVLIPFPFLFNKKLSEITNMNAYSKSFDFLKDEPELYSIKDIKKKYV